MTQFNDIIFTSTNRSCSEISFDSIIIMMFLFDSIMFGVGPEHAWFILAYIAESQYILVGNTVTLL